MDDNKRSVDIDNNKDEERMENDFLDDEMMELPMIPLRGLSVFPNMVLHLT